MTNSPLFSIIIPTYNRAGFIRKTIESVLTQTFQDFEIIVVDDGSTDDTGKVVKSITSNQLRYLKKENAERGAARNYGSVAANGLYLAFLDSDDLIYPHHLSTAHEFIKSQGNPEIFHLGYDIKNEDGTCLKTMGEIKNINTVILSGNCLSCNGVFVRKDIMLQNPFNEDRDLASLEDWELWIRMCARFPFLSANAITSTIVQHSERSVMGSDTLKIKRKADRFVQYVLQDEINQRRYGKKLNIAEASAWTYTALHLAMAKAPAGDVLLYLWKGIHSNPMEIIKKRFFVIVKKLLGL
ncbi:MAG TPA: hypothetical protein DGG95_13205 [Cytophagales bacterium]|jgi:glycosyltransferase involved in cell wall biosynthesis|nr:hypothetical protein [Cytophagales bacterium]